VISISVSVYDITDSDSFLRVTKWVKELKQMASKDIVMAIAANKSDLVRLKNIDTQDEQGICLCYSTFNLSKFYISIFFLTISSLTPQ
jgi:GTPase SAR1 family protein